MPITKTVQVPTQLVFRNHDKNGLNVGTSTAPAWQNPPDPPETINKPSWFSQITTTSERSPHPGVAKPRYISIPKKRKPFRWKNPVPPVYRPPRQPVPLVRRANSSDASYQRAVRKYMAKREAWFRARAQYDHEYGQRQRDFKLLVRRYEAAKAAYLSRPLGNIKKLVGGKTSYTRNNPYSKTYVTNNLHEYNYRRRQYVKLFPTSKINGIQQYEWRVVREVTPHVQFERAMYGRTDTPWGQETETRLELPSQINSAPLIDVATRKSTAQLYEQVSESAVMLGQMVAERAQMYSLYCNAFDGLQAFLKSPKRAVIEAVSGGISKLSKKASNAFLQYCFGVEPLVNDVYTFARRLATDFNEYPDKVKIRSGGSAKDHVTKTTVSGYFTTVEITTIEVRVRHMLEYNVGNQFLHSFNSWGVLNPAQIAWEVMPWSFVVDWFIPIGKALNSLSADAGLTFAGGTTSTEVTTTRTVTRTFGKPTSSLAVWGHDTVGVVRRYHRSVTKSRTVLTSPPVPSLPRFKSPMSTRHFALSLALWRQRA